MATALDAIEEVLKATNEPLHYLEITDQIIKQGLWSTEGKTPQDTISASLSIDLKTKGEKSRFIKISRGYYGLRYKTYAEASSFETALFDNFEEKFSFADAAEVILEQSGSQQPLHYTEIAKSMLNQKLVSTRSKAPEITLHASIVQENKRFNNSGELPRFTIKKGFIGLTKWMPKGISEEIQLRNEEAHEKLLDYLKTMTSYDFEKLVNILLIRMGFEENAETTSASHDEGIDVRGTLVVGDVIRTRLAVQVKLYKKQNKIPPSDIQKLRGSLSPHEQGLFITTSDFTSGAKIEAARSNAVPIALMNGKQLVRLLIENEIGVKRHNLLEVVNFTLDDFEYQQEVS